MKPLCLSQHRKVYFTVHYNLYSYINLWFTIENWYLALKFIWYVLGITYYYILIHSFRFGLISFLWCTLHLSLLVDLFRLRNFVRECVRTHYYLHGTCPHSLCRQTIFIKKTVLIKGLFNAYFSKDIRKYFILHNSDLTT